MKPRLLDLFCGAGGCSVGYARSGFEVVGVDIRPQPNYPFEFFQMDALDWLRALARKRRIHGGLAGPTTPTDFVAIHASPPCQAYSVLRRANPDAEYPDLIAPTRELLERTGRPWVMENVPGAPLSQSVTLCGSTFGLGAVSGDGVKAERMYRQLRRHRLFETSFPIMQSLCQHTGEALGVYGGGPTGRYTFENGARKDRYGRRGGYQGTVAEKREAMGIDWMNASELNQAIPPAYCEFIGEALLTHLEAERRAAA